jgi:alkylhydroperoxidase family enzyme
VAALAGGAVLWFAASPGRTPSPVVAPSPAVTSRAPAVPFGHDLAFPALSDADAWAALPDRVRGTECPLPVWARVLARTLPHTTAAMLELDHLHRTRSPLGPILRGQVRWAAARANRSPYGEAYALADLRAAGASETDLRALTEDQTALPDETRAVVAFARRLASAADTLSDGEVARLVARYGEKQVVAIVLCVAHANFQDRLLLTLGATVEPGGPLPPLDVRFARRTFASGSKTPPRLPPPMSPAPPTVGGLADPDWAPQELAALKSGLDAQKVTRPRIALPDVRGVNRWGLVGQTYQPELAAGWSACTQAFGEEADQDPVFEQSVFWVVTRTTRCFY